MLYLLGRQEKEKKTQEMQKMISVRYRDLIESADKIVTMHSAALRLEVALKEMPQKWKQIEATLASTLAQAPLAKSAQSDVFDAASSSEDQSTSLLQRTIGEQVAFIVTVPEKMWSALDKGESFEALELYLQAKEIYESPALQAAIVKHPFLAAQWACAQSFRPVRAFTWAAAGCIPAPLTWLCLRLRYREWWLEPRHS